MEFDYIIIGAGSGGCAAAKGLCDADIGTVCVLEAGSSDAVPQVKVPFGLLYHPVGTLAMGLGSQPVAPDLKVKQVDGLWVADASVMPQITSANTNAPSMMIGHAAAKFIRMNESQKQ